MADIEKVIKGLTQCTSVNTQTKCHACPYWGSKDGFSDCDGMKADALELLKSQQAEIERLTLSGEWKRMSDLPIETDDRFECSICGNVVHYRDRINLYTFNDYCGRCGAYNGFKLRTVSRNDYSTSNK